MMVTWELLPERWHSRSIFHAGFLLLCLPPIGIASIAALRILTFDDAALIRNRLFWPAALVLAVLPLIFILRRLAAASRLMLGILLYSWPLLAVVQVQAWKTSLRFPDAPFADAPLAGALPDKTGRHRVVWIVFDELSQEVVFGRRPTKLQ